MCRPAKYSNPKQLEKKITEYFADCDLKGKRYNIAGLNLFCGFINRHGLTEMAGDKPIFSATVSHAKLQIEDQRINDLVSPGNGNVNGMKFDLTNNFGWVDEKKQDINIGGQANNPLEFKITFVKPD